MSIFFTDYKPVIIQCAKKYSASYQEKYKDDSIEERAVAIKLFSHVSDFVNEIPNRELKKAVRTARYGTDEVTLSILQNMLLFYINEAVNMPVEAYLSTAVKAYRFVNGKKLEAGTIDKTQYSANDELLYSIVPVEIINASEHGADYYEDLSDVTKPLVDSAIRMGKIFGYSEEEVLEKMNDARESECIEVTEFVLDEFEEYQNAEGLDIASIKEILSGEGNYIGKYHRFVVSPDYVTRNGSEYELHATYKTPPRDAFYEFNTFKEGDPFISMDVVINCGQYKMVYDEYDDLVVCGIVECGLIEGECVTFKALSIKPAVATDKYVGEDGFSPNVTVNNSHVITTLKHVDFYDDTLRLFLSIRNERDVKIELFLPISVEIIQNGKRYDYDNYEPETDFAYPDWPEEILPGEEVSGYIVIDGPNRSDSFSVRIPFYPEGGKFPGRIIIPCERSDVRLSPAKKELVNVRSFLNDRFKETIFDNYDWNHEGSLLSPNEIAFSLIKQAMDNGICKNYESLPGIPTILKQQTGELIESLCKFMTEHFERYLVGKEINNSFELIHSMLFQDCIYAGMASMTLLKYCPTRLQDEGLASILKGKDYYYDLEDVVRGLKGIALATENGEKIAKAIRSNDEYYFYHTEIERHKNTGNLSMAAEQLVSCCIGLYCYGIILQMSSFAN